MSTMLKGNRELGLILYTPAKVMYVLDMDMEYDAKYGIQREM